MTAVMNKIPTTVQNLNLSGAFRGSVDPYVIADRLPDLDSLTLITGHHPDDNNTTSPFPTVAVKVTNYNVSANDFRTVVKDTGNGRYSFEDLPDLVTLDISGNYYATGALNIVSSKITSANLYNVGFQVPTFPNASGTLQSFNGSYMRNAGTFFTGGGNYKFANFTALSTINFDHAGLSGAFPEFTNPVLTSLNLLYTSISGGTFYSWRYNLCNTSRNICKHTTAV